MAKLFFLNVREKISLESTQKYDTSYLHISCITCNGTGILELTIEPDSLAIEE